MANWISQKVQGYVAAGGDYVGNSITGVGDSVNSYGKSLGDSIASTTRGWGQGVSGYGNDIKDMSRAEGPRKQTAANPLGLSGANNRAPTTVPKKVTPAAAKPVVKKAPVGTAAAKKTPIGTTGAKKTPVPVKKTTTTTTASVKKTTRPAGKTGTAKDPLGIGK